MGTLNSYQKKNAGQLLPHFLSHRLFSKSLDKIHFIAQKNDSLLALKMFADSYLRTFRNEMLEANVK